MSTKDLAYYQNTQAEHNEKVSDTLNALKENAETETNLQRVAALGGCTTDRYYVDEHCKDIIQLYYNPDALSGGQFVETIIPMQLIIAESNNSDFWSAIESQSRQFLYDVDSDTFPDIFLQYERVWDFEGRTEDVKKALIAQSHATLAQTAPAIVATPKKGR